MNEDLIRRCDAMDAIRAQLRSGDPFESGFAQRINAIPAAVKIVRCKSCTYFTEDMAIGMCKRNPDKPVFPVPYNHYCTFGVRRDDA